MALYKHIFPRRNTLLVVIHVEDAVQALRNVRIAFEEGADGVFLINHKLSARELLRCYEVIREVFLNEWIGINWLDLLSPTDALAMMEPSMRGMWIDNAGIEEGSYRDTEAKLFSEERRKWGLVKDASFLLFGGVAFKYQKPVNDLELVAKLAMPYIDVITTSGSATGVAASIDKIRIMKQAIGNHPLAVASGITPENVRQYMEHVDCFLVATGISNTHTELNPARVRAIAQIISS